MAGLLWEKKTAQGVTAHYLRAESGEYNAAFTWSPAESRQERLLDGTGKTADKIKRILQKIKYHCVIDSYKKQLVLDIKLQNFMLNYMY